MGTGERLRFVLDERGSSTESVARCDMEVFPNRLPITHARFVALLAKPVLTAARRQLFINTKLHTGFRSPCNSLVDDGSTLDETFIPGRVQDGGVQGVYSVQLDATSA